MPTGLASTMIVVYLYDEKCGIAVAGESAALTLLNASVCSCSHFQVASLRVTLRRGSVMVAQFRMTGALYLRCRERNAAQSDFEVKPRLEAPYLSQGRG